MLFTVFSGCSSLREVITGMMACQGRLSHLGLTNTPRRSTLSDANKRRDEGFFRELFHRLSKKYYPKVLPDSYHHKSIMDRLLIIDSTTITLFSRVMRGTGSLGLNGKKKGGAKAHVLMKATEDVPCFIHITEGIRSDKLFIKQMPLPENSIVVLDKGYNFFKQFELWDQEKVSWITRLSSRTVIDYICDVEVGKEAQEAGITSDQYVLLGREDTGQIFARLIRYQYLDERTGEVKEFAFITNNIELDAATVALIYQKRWQIEILFKRIKQNFPLRYFLGDSANAIAIQLWCTFIADLLLMIVKRKVDKIRNKSWSYANLASLVRQHLGTYIDLTAFLINPEKSLLKWTQTQKKSPQQMIMFTG